MFYTAYLLQSLRKGYQTNSYIGSTPDPVKRIRQHNCEIKGGAKKTKKRGPWKMVLFVWGFQLKFDALCFEWSWQHPGKSRHIKHLNKPSSRSDRISSSIHTLMQLLQSPRWSRYPLNIQIFESDIASLPCFTSQLPPHILINYTPFDPSFINSVKSEYETGSSKKQQQQQQRTIKEFRYSLRRGQGMSDDCLICFESTCSTTTTLTANTKKGRTNKTEPVLDLNEDMLICQNIECLAIFHHECLASWFLFEEGLRRATVVEYLMPVYGTCPNCKQEHRWADWIRFNRDDENVDCTKDEEESSLSSESDADDLDEPKKLLVDV